MQAAGQIKDRIFPGKQADVGNATPRKKRD
jgi:hypothetical protein